MPKLLIDDYNIRGKGAKLVADYFLSRLREKNIDYDLISDSFIGKFFKIPNYLERFLVGIRYFNRPILVLGDFPVPFVKKQVVYVQQALLTSDKFSLSYPKRHYFRYTSKHPRKFIVQSNALAVSISQRFNVDVNKFIIDKSLRNDSSFFKYITPKSHPEAVSPFYICLTSNYPHKGNDELAEYWNSFIYPTLKVPLMMTCAGKSTVGVKYLGTLERNKVVNLLLGSRGLVSNSYCESLFIPALEAINNGIPTYLRSTDVIEELYRDKSFLFSELECLKSELSKLKDLNEVKTIQHNFDMHFSLGNDVFEEVRELVYGSNM